MANMPKCGGVDQEELIAEFLAKLFAGVCGLARPMGVKPESALPNGHSIEGLVFDAFEKFYDGKLKHLNKYTNLSALGYSDLEDLRSKLIKVVIRDLINALKSKERKVVTTLETPIVINGSSESPTPLTLAETLEDESACNCLVANEEIAKIADCGVRNHPLMHKKPLLLRIYEIFRYDPDTTSAELAKTLNVPVSTIYNSNKELKRVYADVVISMKRDNLL
jgi:DNA-directed RNA polymerase specialized sigma24 family protein